MVTIADSCVSLGTTHAEVTFVDELCSHRRKMTISKLRTRLHYLERCGVPLPLPQSSFRHGGSQAGATSSSSSGSLSMTVMATPLENQPSGDHHSSCTPQPDGNGSRVFILKENFSFSESRLTKYISLQI